MKAFIFQAALLCEHCGTRARAELTAAGKAPDSPDDENTYDSDAFPKGPYGDGGGEADSPQSCDECGTFLENPLTPDGDTYLRERADSAAAEFKAETGKVDGEYSWEEVAVWCDENGKTVLAEWIRYYLAWGQ